MTLRVFVLVMLAAALAPAQVTVAGFITSRTEPVDVEMVVFHYPGLDSTLPTPGWSAGPGDTAR